MKELVALLVTILLVAAGLFIANKNVTSTSDELESKVFKILMTKKAEDFVRHSEFSQILYSVNDDKNYIGLYRINSFGSCKVIYVTPDNTSLSSRIFYLKNDKCLRLLGKIEGR